MQEKSEFAEKTQNLDGKFDWNAGKTSMTTRKNYKSGEKC